MADERINRHMPCVHCGYNLRTLKLNARCPECANPVRHTADIYRRGVRPLNRWVTRLGTGLLTVVLVAALVLLLIGAFWLLVGLLYVAGTLLYFGVIAALFFACGVLLLAAWQVLDHFLTQRRIPRPEPPPTP